MALTSAQPWWQPSGDWSPHMRNCAETGNKRGQRDDFSLLITREPAERKLPAPCWLDFPMAYDQSVKPTTYQGSWGPSWLGMCRLDLLAPSLCILILMDPCWTCCNFPETLFPFLSEHGPLKHCSPPQLPPSSFLLADFGCCHLPPPFASGAACLAPVVTVGCLSSAFARYILQSITI